MKRTSRYILSIAITSMLFAPALAQADTPKSAEKPATQPAADEETKVKKVSLAEFEKLAAQKDSVVLDVRTPREFVAGHMPGAVNIDWHARDFKDRVEKLDKSKTYLLHCHAGVRSAAAAKAMSAMEFSRLYDYSGGWAEYQKSGKPVEK